MSPQEKTEFIKTVVKAVHESFATNTPSQGTQNMFREHQRALDTLALSIQATDRKVDALLALIGNLKFSGKAAFWVGSGIIGVVAFFTAGKALLAWFGVAIIKQ